MDKQSIWGFILIFVIVVGWMYWEQSQVKPPEKSEIKKDSTLKLKDSLAPASSQNLVAPQVPDSSGINPKYGKFFTKLSDGNERIITIENKLFIAKISTKGAKILKWKLKKFNKWDKVPTQLIQDTKGELSLSFLTYDGIKIDSRDLYFSADNIADSIYVGDKPYSFSMYIEPENGRKIIRTFKFLPNEYIFDTEVITENMETIIPANRGYNLNWNNGLTYQEHNSVDESSDAHAMVQLNANLAELNADKDTPVESTETGMIDYAAIKTKYFGVAIIPNPWQSFDGTVDLYGKKIGLRHSGVRETYEMSFRIPFKEGVQKRSFRVYIGPLDYDIVSKYGINNMVNLGWKYGIRQIGEYFMMPILKFIHKFVPNYGFAIIILSIIMKILLYPLSIQQMKQSQKMQLLTPELTKLREKYKDDQMKLSQETMKLQSEYGINPAGGCLPMLLQMPILIALWQLLRSAIEMRQAPFMLWIHDLSVPDKILDFGGVNVLGLTSISGLALLMGITMFIQQKMTITDPKQKFMIYFMPVMFTFMFSNFPAGLNLYYFFFNIWSILHQYYINNFDPKKPTLEELKRAPKKQGWLQKKMEEAQKIAEAQGRTVPGQKAPQRPQRNNKNNSKK